MEDSTLSNSIEFIWGRLVHVLALQKGIGLQEFSHGVDVPTDILLRFTQGKYTPSESGLSHEDFIQKACEFLGVDFDAFKAFAEKARDPTFSWDSEETVAECKALLAGKAP